MASPTGRSAAAIEQPDGEVSTLSAERKLRRSRLADAFAELQETTHALDEYDTARPLNAWSPDLRARRGTSSAEMPATKKATSTRRARDVARPTVSSTRRMEQVNKGLKRPQTSRAANKQRPAPRPPAFTPQKQSVARRSDDWSFSTPSRGSVADDEERKNDTFGHQNEGVQKDKNFASGYLEGLRMSQLKQKRAPPLGLAFDENDELLHEQTLLKNTQLQLSNVLRRPHHPSPPPPSFPDVTNKEVRHGGGDDLQTRTQLMGLYTNWEAKLKQRENALQLRERTMEERERALTADATTLSESSRQLEQLKKKTEAKRQSLVAVERDIHYVQSSLTDKERASKRKMSWLHSAPPSRITSLC
eukprot:g4661.t1